MYLKCVKFNDYIYRGTAVDVKYAMHCSHIVFWRIQSCVIITQGFWNRGILRHISIKQSGTKPNYVAKKLATKFGNHFAQVTKIGSQH